MERDEDPNEAGTTSTDESVDFETAIQAAGFGCYNVLLLIIAIPCNMANYFETSTMSYILPSAECDLQLSLQDKGYLNAITYVGMITSAIFWGCISDAKGRIKCLIIAYFLDTICVIGGATSRTFIQLMIFKLLGGFVMGGPFAILMAYLSEMHSKSYRPYVIMTMGFMMALSSLILPLLAIAILPHQYHTKILNYEVSILPWQVFLLVSAIPSLSGAILLLFFHESPKFLMSKGRTDKALKVFRCIYSINKRKPKDNYPVKNVENELAASVSRTMVVGDGSASAMKSLANDFKYQARVMLRKPYLRYSIQIYIMNFLVLLGHNTMRLWLPSLFAFYEEYEHMMGKPDSMCNIVNYSVNKTQILKSEVIDNCQVIITDATYLNNIIVAVMNIAGYVIATVALLYLDVKGILIATLFMATSCGIALYFCFSPLSIIITAGLYNATGSISAMCLITVSVNIFPTTLRALIVSLSMMLGRFGAFIGNVLFPSMMMLGCMPPFLMISFVMLMAGIMGFFLPKTKKTALI